VLLARQHVFRRPLYREYVLASHRAQPRERNPDPRLPVLPANRGIRLIVLDEALAEVDSAVSQRREQSTHVKHPELHLDLAHQQLPQPLLPVPASQRPTKEHPPDCAAPEPTPSGRTLELSPDSLQRQNVAAARNASTHIAKYEFLLDRRVTTVPQLQINYSDHDFLQSLPRERSVMVVVEPAGDHDDRVCLNVVHETVFFRDSP